MKRCSKCGNEYPATTEYFNIHSGTRLRSECRQCSAKYHQQYRMEHPEIRRETERKTKLKNREKINERRRKWHAENRETRNEYQREWQRANKEKIKEYRQKWETQNAEYLREKKREYSNNNPEIAREHTRKYRSAKRNLPISFSKNDEKRSLEYFNGCCAVCLRPLRDLFGDHTVAWDHWIAISDPRPDNPGTVPENMVPLCQGKEGCNNKKSNADPMEWLEREYGKRKARKILDRIEKFFEWVKETHHE